MWVALKKAGEVVVRAVRSLLAAMVIVVLVAGTSYVVAAWQVTQERFERQAEMDRLRAEFAAKLEGAVAAQAAGQNQAGGAGTGGGAGEAAPGYDEAFRAAVERRLASLEEAVRQGLGQNQVEEQRLALSLQVKTLLLKAKSEVLQVQLDLAEDNRGEARRELELAGKTMAEVLAVAPAEARAELTEVIDLLDRARVDLLLGAPTGPDRVSLAWHRLGELVGDFRGK